MKVRKALLLVKRTPYARLRRGKKSAETKMRRLLEDGHRSMAAVAPAHEAHIESERLVKRELADRGIETSEHANPSRKRMTDVDLVITIGGDGTLLRASHAVRDDTPVLGVNSAPAFSVGFLTCCRAPTFAQMLDDLIADRIRPAVVHRLQVRIGRRSVPVPVLNDVLFCHDNPATTTRYRLVVPDGDEDQKSSGVWIAAPAGTTAALRSAGGEPIPVTDRRFAYVVREPYAPPGSSVRHRGGVLEHDETLAIECRVAPASVFLDGSHRRFSVPFGQNVTCRLHDRPLQLVGPPTVPLSRT